MKERSDADFIEAGDAAACPPCIAQPLFVLVQPSRAGNVGAAARAIKTLGFEQLALVAARHRDVRAQPEALAFASGADDVLRAAREGQSLDAVAADCGVLVALSARVRDFGPPLHGPDWLPQLARSAAAQGRRVAFVFGNERAGLDNATVYGCDALLSLPTSPQYGSLNLSQAVQIVAWEWRRALGGFTLPQGPQAEPAATRAEVRELLEQARRALLALGFLDPAAPRRLIPRLERLAARSALSRQEVQILRGICRAVLLRCEQGD